MSTQEFRLAILHRLVAERQDIGKTELQKLIYFLQEALDVPTRYSFRMHHYGPFAESIETDLARLELTGFVEVEPDRQGYGFHITPLDSPIDGWRRMVQPYTDSIDRTLQFFEDWPTYELELAATIHFVRNLLPNARTEEVLEKVRALKPKFSMDQVARSHQELVNRRILPPDDPRI